MIRAISLRNTIAILTFLAFLAFLFSTIYLVFVPRTFAKTNPPESRRQAQVAKLDATKLRVCQVHEKNIKSRLESLTKLVTNQEEKFSAIAARVQNHYTTKLVPEGKTVANYDELVADIDSKKAAVDSALEAAKTGASDFSCDGDDPKGLLTQFRKDMQAVKVALKDYRKSVRNLIVAIRGEKAASTPSPTPAP